MGNKKEVIEEVKPKSLNVEITQAKAHKADGSQHKVGEKLSFQDGKLPSYLVGKCRVLVNGKA